MLSYDFFTQIQFEFLQSVGEVVFITVALGDLAQDFRSEALIRNVSKTRSDPRLSYAPIGFRTIESAEFPEILDIVRVSQKIRISLKLCPVIVMQGFPNPLPSL